MSSAGSKAGQGAISGAAAGSAFGPWGMAAGAVIGGVGGYLQGDDPTAPPYIAPPPPVTPGGMSSQYGGTQIDPVTGRVIYTDNTVNGYDQASNYQRQLMMQSMLGGNGAQVGMDSQIAQARAYLAQLQQQGSKSTPKNIPAEYRDLQKFLNPDGSLPDIGDTNAIYDGRINDPASKALRDEFNSKVKNYGGGGAIGFGKWVRDFTQRNLQPMQQAFQKMQDVQGGNADTNAQAIQAAQQRLDNLLKVQGSGAQTEADFAKNPLMNFLNQRNTAPGGPADYDALRQKYDDPNAAVMQDQFKKYLGQADQITDSTAFKIAGGADPGMPDAQAANARLLAAANGSVGGERMAAQDPFHSNAGAVVNNLNRTAERNYASQAGLQSQLNARRGVMGGSGDINRLAMQQALEDNRAANAAQGYGLERADRSAWDQMNFAINSHNSDVAKTGAQFNLNAVGQAFGNELAAKDFYNRMQQQAWLNNQGEQQRNFGNAMTSLNQTTGLNQNAINNARYEQGYEDTANRQNYADRMGLLGFLQGADQQSWSQGIGNSSMALNQSGQALGVSQGIAGNTNSWNASNAAGQNAQANAAYGQAINDSAQWQNTIGQAAQGFGQGFASWDMGAPDPQAPVSHNPATSPGQVGTSTTTGVGQVREQPSNLFPQTAAPSYGVYNPAQPAAAPAAAAPWSYSGGVWNPPAAPRKG